MKCLVKIDRSVWKMLNFGKVTFMSHHISLWLCALCLNTICASLTVLKVLFHGPFLTLPHVFQNESIIYNLCPTLVYYRPHNPLPTRYSQSKFDRIRIIKHQYCQMSFPYTQPCVLYKTSRLSMWSYNIMVLEACDIPSFWYCG